MTFAYLEIFCRACLKYSKQDAALEAQMHRFTEYIYA